MSTTATEADLLYPLSLLRERRTEALPAVEVLDGPAVPPPYQQLLVHQGDMTSRLEALYGGKIVLEVRHCEHTAEAYRREVVLRLASNGAAVEYGAIEIVLREFSPAMRAAILEGKLPLGGLMNAHGVVYRSQPRAFIRIGADEEMERIYAQPGATEYYGRCNELLGAQGQVLARIVEILQPGLANPERPV